MPRSRAPRASTRAMPMRRWFRRGKQVPVGELVVDRSTGTPSSSRCSTGPTCALLCAARARVSDLVKSSSPTTQSWSFPTRDRLHAARDRPQVPKEAVLVRSNGDLRDLRAPLADGERIQILTTRRQVYRTRSTCSATHPAPAGRGRRRLYLGVKIAIGLPIHRLLLRLRVPRADPRGRPGEDRGRALQRAEGRAVVVARGDLPRRGEEAVRGGRRALQGRARRHRRGRHLAVHAG